MPELPEVETIVRELKERISGKKLCGFFIFDKRLGRLHLPLPLKIISVDRHGKYVVIHTHLGKILLHLRMTGKLLLKKQQSLDRAGLTYVENKRERKVGLPEKHERARFIFSGGLVLEFFDPRRFGTIEWRKRDLPELGLNPLGREFNVENFRKILSSRSRAVKSLLLDQKFIAGLGNIYANESLWLAKINPRRKSNSLFAADVRQLVASIKRVLRRAIKKEGFTLRDYRKPSGKTGSYQEFRKVYGREGLPCFRCQGRIERVKASSRSTYSCPVCQRL